MKQPPEISISRVAVYLRFLEDYLKENGPQSTINSSQLAKFLNINHHQIRKDLSYFGKFGEPGVGYRADELKERISKILGLRKKWNLCLCGLGNLGSALFAYKGFKVMNLNIVAIFDSNPRKIGRTINQVKVYDPANMQGVIDKMGVNMAIIAVPTEAAQDTVDKLVRSDVRAILNFAPIKLSIPAGVKLRNVDLATELINLTYFLSSSA